MTTDIDTDAAIAELSSLEKACEACQGTSYAMVDAHGIVTNWSPCPTCKGTGKVARVEWARVEPCGKWEGHSHCVHGPAINCPGYRAATLSEIRQRLEEVLKSLWDASCYISLWSPDSLAIEGQLEFELEDWATPAEAAIMAVHASTKVQP